MTTGGFLAALTFVASALIELQIQSNLPAIAPQMGQANLLLVNGISDCSVVDPTVVSSNETAFISSLQPLSTQRVALPANDQLGQFQPYKLAFKLANNEPTSLVSPIKPTQVVIPAGAAAAASNTTIKVGCPFDSKQNNELMIGPLPDQTVGLLYIEHGNGKLSYKMFTESLALPPPGKARVRLLYESFGSYAQALKRQFHLSNNFNSTDTNSETQSGLKFNMTTRDGQVLLSEPIDVPVGSAGDMFTLKIDEDGSWSNHTTKIHLKPGTRNLIILHQRDAKSFELRHELLQDNDYRISIIYQLIPYFMISASEVLFSITGLEFSYAMAPPDMKSLILAAWSVAIAIGNLLTVVIESIHPFSNLAYDFFFYAALMVLDIVIFAVIGLKYEPSIKSQSLKLQKLK